MHFSFYVDIRLFGCFSILICYLSIVFSIFNVCCVFAVVEVVAVAMPAAFKQFRLRLFFWVYGLCF